MRHMTGFMNSWNDTKGIEKLRGSSKSTEVEKSDAENYLKEMSLRFERPLNQTVLNTWARDFIESGYQAWMIKEVCKSIPYKFERSPTFAQIIELLRSYLTKKETQLDELTDLTNRCLPSIREKFFKIFNQDQMSQMCKLYQDKVFTDAKMFNTSQQEMLVLCDWLRSYFGTGAQLLGQGLKSNMAHEADDREYFTKQLRAYAKEHNL